MNLIPIDAGGTTPELGGGDASPGGEFADLMTGLMSGDTQIVPLLDLPIGEQLTAMSRTGDGDTTADDTAVPLEFIGTPPAGMVMTAPIGDPLRAGLTAVADEVPAPTGDAAEPLAIVPIPDGPIAEQATGEAAVDTAAVTGLATVHPISNHVSPDDAAQDAVKEGPVQGSAAPQSAAPESAVPAGGVPAGAVPENAAPGTHRTLGSTPSQATPTPIDAASVAAPVTTATNPVDGSRTLPLTATPGSNTEQNVATDPQPSQPGVEVEAGSAPRSIDTARPAASIPQPAMVGIARRVEEAIAALATKPDPKIVTLQLDELDGLRLTVALRPDGLHLSSTGDGALTTEIERALAARGFDMASSGDGDRQGSEETTDDGWRPQSAQPGQRRRSNQSGIRL